MRTKLPFLPHRFIALSLMTALAMSGCSRMGLNNNALDYQKVRLAAPLLLPDGVTARPSNALYPVPATSAEDNQYQPGEKRRQLLPAPPKITVLPENGLILGRPDRPLLVNDGNGYPLLRLEGDPTQGFELLTAAVRASGLTVQSIEANQRQLRVQSEGRSYWIRMNVAGALSQVMVQDDARRLSDQAIATRLLAAIQQAWPNN